ncbi:hypothetical protein C4564_05240 [Candidatus Microgenomates bacterium]|nr:MAG: hypothetical protein C4564_05240 [Candidatus Microgenomates bacterium]
MSTKHEELLVRKFFRDLMLYGTDEWVGPVVSNSLATAMRKFLGIQPHTDNIIANVPFMDVALRNTQPSQHSDSILQAVRSVFKAQKLADFMTRLADGNDWHIIRFLSILICIVNSDESQYQRLAANLDDDWIDEATIVWEEFFGRAEVTINDTMRMFSDDDVLVFEPLVLGGLELIETRKAMGQFVVNGYVPLLMLAGIEDEEICKRALRKFAQEAGIGADQVTSLITYCEAEDQYAHGLLQSACDMLMLTSNFASAELLINRLNARRRMDFANALSGYPRADSFLSLLFPMYQPLASEAVLHPISGEGFWGLWLFFTGGLE